MKTPEIREAPVPVSWGWGVGGYIAEPCIIGDPWWVRHMQSKRGVGDLLGDIFESLTVELSNGQTVIVRAKS